MHNDKTNPIQSIGCVSLLVEDYDDALAFFTQQLQFSLVDDMDLGEGHRWVQVAPPHSSGPNILLTKANSNAQLEVLGKQAGDGVLMILQTNDFWRDYRVFKSNGVVFLEEPRVEDYGTVVIFRDISGNKWDLIESS